MQCTSMANTEEAFANKDADMLMCGWELVHYSLGNQISRVVSV